MINIFHNHSIVLGVGGGIAAYKICNLASQLTQQGANVQTVLTESAQQFVTPLTFAALTGQPVHTALAPQDYSSVSGAMASMAHIDLARNSDAILIAPATANLLAKLAHGIADDLLTTLVLAATVPVLVAPSMNPTMLAHPATQRNLKTIAELGYTIIAPESGRTACREEGSGRLPEIKVLLEALENAIVSRKSTFTAAEGLTILITAGPTRESLDPVRFLSNHSTGKMGYALAEAAAKMGAKVLLVSGPTNLASPNGAELLPVVTAQEMFETVTSNAPQCDIIISAAAPADFYLAEISPQKMKKQNEPLRLELQRTPDIISHVAAQKKSHQIIVGFAAETNNGAENAREKLISKNLDAIVLNDITQSGAGFGTDTNQVTWLTKTQEEAWPMLSKQAVAARILERALALLK